MPVEDETSRQIAEILAEAKRRADKASEDYLAKVITLFIWANPQMGMIVQQQLIGTAMQEGEAVGNRIKPLIPFILPVFKKPGDCSVYEVAVKQVVNVGMSLPKAYPDILDKDIESAVNFMSLIHSARCTNPQSHKQ